MATEFTVANVTFAGPFPETITFASLSAPLSGTLPTFTTAPIVFVRNSSTNRYLFVDRTAITTSGFDVGASDIFSDDPPYTGDIGIITTDVTPAGAGVATAVSYPYYCAVQDVQDVLIEFDRSFGSDTTAVNLDDNKITRFISMAFGRINASIYQGRYTTPAANTTKQVITNSLTASTSTAEQVRTLNQVEDGTLFTAGDTVRLHGPSGVTYSDEFTQVVAVSNDLVDVLYLKNSYDALSTVEIVLPGMETLRHLNAQGAALLAVGGLTLGFSTEENSKEGSLATEFNNELTLIQEHKIALPGLARVDPVTTYIRDNASKLPNDGLPVFWSNSSAGTKY